MDNYVELAGVIICAVALFAAIMVCLAVPPKMTKKLIGTFAFITAIGSLVFYGYGYAFTDDSFWVAVFRATFAACGVFVGSNSWDDVGSAYTEPILQIIFWLLHLMGLFTSAGAAITALGSGLLRRIRLWASQRRDISIIFGLNEDTLSFGRELMERGTSCVLYVEGNPENSMSYAVDQMGAILRSDPDACDATSRFLKSVGLKRGKRRVWVYALSKNCISNQQYANHILASMRAGDINSRQTALTLLGPGDEMNNRFLTRPGQYGFGSVISINEPEMVARMLVRTYPPCDVISFDKAGKAENDFHGLVIGFGQVGQAVLQQLVMNGQFHGNRFRLAVFAPDYEQMMGRLSHECGSMLEHYEINFYGYDGRSRPMYDYIAKHADSLNYITICAGKSGINLEIAQQLHSFLKHVGCGAPIYMCSHSDICHQIGDDRLVVQRIYSPDILCSDQIDRMAMVLNQSYVGSGDMRENWQNCGYFNRVSSRAAADFHHALLRAAGVTEEEARANWNPTGELLENLSISEHLRWNAFHYCMGFRPMTEEEFDARAAVYREEKQKNPNTKFRITRDMDKRIHACIIPWEELDAYSAKENAVTGANRDYCENDRINIRSLADVLRAMDAGK